MPWKGYLKPPAELVVLTKLFVEMLDKLGYDIQLVYVKKKAGGDAL